MGSKHSDGRLIGGGLRFDSDYNLTVTAHLWQDQEQGSFITSLKSAP